MSPRQLARGPETTVYRQVAAYYKELIDIGTIRPGGKLPSVAEMCRTWEIANGTAVAVVKALKDDGYVTTVHGAGTFAREVSGAPRTDSDNPVAK